MMWQKCGRHDDDRHGVIWSGGHGKSVAQSVLMTSQYLFVDTLTPSNRQGVRTFQPFTLHLT